MKEVIDKIVEVENKARESIQEAHEKADKMILDTEKEVAALLKEAQEKAAIEAERVIKDKELQSQNKKEAEIKKATLSFAKFKKDKIDKIEEVASLIFEEIVKVES